jgi:hypothetical protein
VTVLSAPPTKSHIDSIVGGVGSVSVAGWAVWPDKLSTSVTLAIQVGNSWTAVTANSSNSDSGQPAGAGTNHGFSATLALAPGTYSVCVWANSSGGGAASNIGCQSVTVLSAPPMKDYVAPTTGHAGYANVAGWAIWPDKPTATVDMAIQVGNNWTAMYANTTSADPAELAVGAGANHGFNQNVTLRPGSYSICVWASQSVGPAVNLGCQTVTVTAPTS